MYVDLDVHKAEEQRKLEEMGGNPITSMFPNKDQFGGNTGCQFKTKCYIDESQDCRISRAVYRIECQSCLEEERKFVYIGTTGFNIHKRSLEHVKSVRQKNQNNALAKHMSLYHSDEEANFVTTCISGGIKFNLNRFILEAIEIEEARLNPEIRVMNSRSEWGGKGLPRIVVQH